MTVTSVVGAQADARSGIDKAATAKSESSFFDMVEIPIEGGQKWTAKTHMVGERERVAVIVIMGERGGAVNEQGPSNRAFSGKTPQ